MDTPTLTTSRRWPWAVGALAAAVVALLVASLLRGTGGPPVIRVADGGGGTTDRAMAGEAAPAMDADLMWHPWVEFVLADGARFGAGEATGWRMEAPDGLRAAATRLAEHFGVDASTMREAPHGGGWMAGPDDGSAPSLWMEASGAWHVSDPTGQPTVRCIDVEPYEGEDGASPPDDAPDRAPGRGPDPDQDDDTTAEGGGVSDSGSTGDDRDPDAIDVVIDRCEPVDPPANVPNEAQARDLATALFAELGLFATPRIEYVHADEWGAWVEAALPIDGMVTDIRTSVGFGAEGRVTWASGTLARAVDVGQYPTIDAEAAVERLQGSPWRGGAMPLPAIDYAEAGDAPASDGQVDRDEPVTSDDPLPRPGPEDVQTRQVTLVASEPSLLMTWDADGTWWLLPGVRFTDADGGTWQVLIVADEYLDTGHDGAEPGTEPEPAPMPEPGQSGGGSAGEPGEPGTVDPMMPADEAAESVIGMAEAEATDRLAAMGYEVRVVARDGESFAVTDDYRTDRVNLEIKDGVVANAYGG